MVEVPPQGGKNGMDKCLGELFFSNFSGSIQVRVLSEMENSRPRARAIQLMRRCLYVDKHDMFVCAPFFA